MYQKTNTGVVNITSASIAYDIFYRPIPQSGVGSGVIIDNLGHIVTNHHVIQDADQLEVTLADKRTFSAKTVGDDPNNDLAVLKIDVSKEKLSPFHWVLQKTCRLGKRFLRLVTRTGWIERSRRESSVLLDEPSQPKTEEGLKVSFRPMRQSTLEIPAVPLLNTSGEVIGINSAIVGTANGGNVGIGFAIPVETVRRITDDLIKLGYVRRPYLGVDAIQFRIILTTRQFLVLIQKACLYLGSQQGHLPRLPVFNRRGLASFVVAGFLLEVTSFLRSITRK